MSLREEMDEAAEKEGQVEKNREQAEKNRERAEENREKIEALETMLETTLEKKLEEKLEEKVEGLKGGVSQTVKEELQRARAKRSETSSLEERASRIEKAATTIENRLDQGIELKGVEDLRRKIGRFLTVADLKKREEKSLSNAMGRLQDWKIQAEGEIQDLKSRLASGVRTIQGSAKTISTGAWWSPVTGLVGGLVGVMMLALLTRVGYPILPQKARMTPSEISRVERSRHLDRVEGQMTEEEYDRYQTLLKKAEKRLGEPQD
jgi:DNA repair exonuclease SbcCD ATPase subunit